MLFSTGAANEKLRAAVFALALLFPPLGFATAQTGKPPRSTPESPQDTCDRPVGEPVDVTDVTAHLELKLADKRLIRIAGIEPVRATKADPRLAEKARADLALWTVGAQVALTALDPAVDRWGRERARAFLAPEQLSLAQALIEAGWARVDPLSETSPCLKSLLQAEAGARARFQGGSSLQVAAFYNRYSNFIATQVVGVAGGLQQFQYRNLSAVEIRGLEARGEWRATDDIRVRAALAYARGEDLRSRRPVDGVDPFRANLGVAWQAPPDSPLHGLGLEANVTAAARNTRVSSAAYYRAPAYGVLDLAARYDLNDRFSINAGLFNATNTRYFLTSDTRQLASNSPQRDLYAQAGRYFAVNLIGRF